ncbi:MAG: ABC transporter permease [archaeon]|nr:ABC transporter permease [archaeon]MCP8306776.1 ABC transporter permease [archaeon]
MASEILEVLIEALELVFSGDPTFLEITTRSILISGTATLLSALWGAPIGMILGLKKFRGKTLLKSLFNALLGIPTVALGLILYLFLSRSGPLGFLQILYTPVGIIIGQSILITPITVSFVTSAIESVDPEIRDLARTLGASETQASITVLGESSGGFLLAVIASFNRAIAELGVALMIGGNIKGITRVLTTTIALETTRGEVVLAIALAIILLTIVSVLSLSINLIQRRRT